MKFGKSHRGVSRTLLLTFASKRKWKRAPQAGVEDLVDRLDGIEDRANHLRVPTMFAQLLYTVRHHISPMRMRLMESDNSRQRAGAFRDDEFQPRVACDAHAILAPNAL